jgi:hypothetical protein
MDLGSDGESFVLPGGFLVVIPGLCCNPSYSSQGCMHISLQSCHPCPFDLQTGRAHGHDVGQVLDIFMAEGLI